MIHSSDVLQLLKYDPEMGNFFWRMSRGKARTGAIAGGVYPNGYRYIGIYGGVYLAHHLVWLIETGEWPIHNLDHKDTNPLNNQFFNLRYCNQTQNLANANLRCNNTSGYKGVSWDKRRNKWVVKVQNKNFGGFEKIEDAVERYREKSIEIFGDFARHG